MFMVSSLKFMKLLGQIFYHLIYHHNQAGNMIFTNIENYFLVYIEIMMTDYVSHSFGVFPVDIAIMIQEIIAGYFIDIFQAFANGDNKHTNGIEFYTSFIGCSEVVGTHYRFTSFHYGLRSSEDIAENPPYRSSVKHIPPRGRCIFLMSDLFLSGNESGQSSREVAPQDRACCRPAREAPASP